MSFLFGRAYGNRTRDSSVKGRCLNPLTNAPSVFKECKNRRTPATHQNFFSPLVTKSGYSTEIQILMSEYT